VQGDNLQFLKTCYRNADPLIKGRVKGKVKLIYIDPPFATKSDFKGSGDEKSYSDKVASTEFIEGLRERLIYMREILANDGSIYVHLDQRMSHYTKVQMDEVFGKNTFRNDLIWHYGQRTEPRKKHFDKKHDTILFYAKPSAEIAISTTMWSREEFIKHRHDVMTDDDGCEFIWTDGGKGNPRYKRYVEDVIDRGKPLDSVWDIPVLNSSVRKRAGFPT
jgi:hypothetical protein